MNTRQVHETSLAQATFLNVHASLMNAPIGIFMTTPQGRFLYANQALADMYGYTSSRDLTVSVQDIAAELFADPRDVSAVTGLLATEGLVKDYECEHIHRDGSRFWASGNIRTVRTKDGNVSHYQGFVTDITARKNAEQAEKESGERFRLMFTNAPIPYQSLDEQGNFLDVNQTFLDVLGYSREDVIGKNFADILHPDWQDHFKENFPKFKAVGEILGVEFELVKKDGSIIFISLNGKIQRDARDRFLRTHCVFQDMSEQRRIEAALRFQEQMIEAASAAVCACDLEGNMLSVNPWFLQAWGFDTPEEVVGRPFQEFWILEERLHKVVSALRQGGHWSEEIKARRKDGSLFDVLVTANLVLDSFGNPTAFMSTSIDITARKHAERKQQKLQSQLFQTQKMQSVGIMAGGLAHDFNNLLHAMRGNVELISRDASLDSPVRARLRTVTKSMNRAAQLVQQLLLFSRKPEPRGLLVDVNQEVQGVTQTLERTIPAMISLTLHLNPSAWTIAGDPVQIELILINLINNAVDAMPEGGRLTIETGNVELSEDFVLSHPGAVAGRHVRLTISDTGRGMDETTLEHAFDPFFTTKEVGKGTGLGLASVYGIVKAHGGHIQCFSEAGSGATFMVYLPAAEQDDLPNHEPRREDFSPGGSETILVVDDEPEIRQLTRESMELLGYTVKSAASGNEALEIYRNEGAFIDLILLDLNMPGMGGHRCLQELLRVNPEVKVIITSGHAAHGHAENAPLSGAKGFIGKPYGFEELATMVRNVLDTSLPQPVRDNGP